MLTECLLTVGAEISGLSDEQVTEVDISLKALEGMTVSSTPSGNEQR